MSTEDASLAEGAKTLAGMFLGGAGIWTSYAVALELGSTPAEVSQLFVGFLIAGYIVMTVWLAHRKRVHQARARERENESDRRRQPKHRRRRL